MGVTATYHGPYTKGYLQYVDLSTYHTLVAVPGNTYDIGIASGWEVLAAVPADGAWTASVAAGPGDFTSVPGIAAPGAFFPGSPGPVPEDGGAMDSELRDEDKAWAERVVASAADGDEVFADIHERLGAAGEKIAALRRRPGRPG